MIDHARPRSRVVLSTRVYTHALIMLLVKAVWCSVLVFLLAAQEPFWHQVLLVLGGAAITAGAVIGAAIITARHVNIIQAQITDESSNIKGDVSDLAKNVEEHREAIEPDRPRNPATRTRSTDSEDSPKD